MSFENAPKTVRKRRSHLKRRIRADPIALDYSTSEEERDRSRSGERIAIVHAVGQDEESSNNVPDQIVNQAEASEIEDIPEAESSQIEDLGNIADEEFSESASIADSATMENIDAELAAEESEMDESRERDDLEPFRLDPNPEMGFG